MKIYIISGGPHAGKTEVVKELGNQGFATLQEVARQVSKTDKRFIGKSINEINRQEFEDKILEVQIKQLEEIKGVERKFFFDRGLGDTLAYYRLNKLKIPSEIFDVLSEFRYEKIFMLEPLNFYEQDDLRQEDFEEQINIHEKIIQTYKDCNYNPLIVPFMGVKKRVEFILRNL